MRIALLLAVLGCSPGAFDPVDDPGANGGSGGANPQGGSSCGPPGPSIDPASLPSCCTDGAARCVPSAFVPMSVTAALSTCQGGYCVPDKFIRAGGVYQPPTCKSLNNADGVCLSLCIPQVAQYSTLLPQSTCDADERCAPCTNPLNNMSSGACDIGKCDNSSTGGTGGTGGTPQCPYSGPPIIDPNTLPDCGTACPAGGAHCVQAALVPSSEQQLLAQCPSGGYCAPDNFIASAGQFIPATCNSLAGAEGRCLSVCIPQVAAQAQMLPQSSCATTEKCVPCYDPLSGMASGACSLSCDPGPTQPPVVFANCCDNQARCVPSTAIPTNLQSNLDTDSCASGYLCVPNENLMPGFVPPTCEADGFLIGHYTGVCLSDCLKFGLQGLVLARGTCQSNHLCAPCFNPLTGAPTGAPGCPQ